MSVQEGISARQRAIGMVALGLVADRNEKSLILEPELVPAPPHVAEVLGIPAAAPAIRRARITSWNGTPYQTSTSWFDGVHAAAAPRLLEIDPIREGSTMYLAAAIGQRFEGRCQEEVWACTAGEEAELLDLPVGSPILCGQNMFLSTESVLEFGESVTAPNRRLTFAFPAFSAE